MVATNRYDRDLARVQLLSQKVTQSTRLSLSELVFFASFVINFVLGKLIHLYSTPEEVYNYYNNKSNVFNQLFVKKGWLWTTLVVALFYAVVVLRKASPTDQRRNANVLLGAAVRYVVATVWWVLFTQWCFGLPIMDRIFLLTGGKCVANEPKAGFLELQGRWESLALSLYGCRRLKGSWEGGHDPSGHVFLLVHSSLYLFQEIRPHWQGWQHLKQSVAGIGAPNPGKLVAFVKSAPYACAVALMGLWWFMLLVTNMYFHSLAEKFVGLLFGYVGIVAVYLAPRWVQRTK